MQIAGEKCGICGQTIGIISEGTWCGKCRVVYHTNCITRTGKCEKCSTSWEDPKKLAVYAKQCPECSAPLAPSAEACHKCRAFTRWDTAEEYAEMKDIVQARGRTYRLLGLVEIVVGAILFISAWVFFILPLMGHARQNSNPTVIVIMLAAGLCALGDGWMRFNKGTAFAKFE